MSKDKGVKLSPKYGLNPSMLQCPCHKDMGIALCGKLKGDAEAPKVMNSELCDDCKKVWITVHEADSKRYTGRVAYVKRESVDNKFQNYDNVAMISEEFEQIFVRNENNRTKS